MEYYIVRDKTSGNYFKGSQGQSSSTFFTKRNVAPKLYTIGAARSVVTQYSKIRPMLELEIIPVELVMKESIK